MPDPTPEELAAQAAAQADASKTKDVTPPDGADKKAASDADHVDPIEVAARAEGWKPREEFSGEPGDFVEAKEYLARKPLYKVIKGQSKSIKKLQETVEAMTGHFEKTVNIAVEARVKELQTQRREAIKEGDVAKVEALDKAIDAHKEGKVEAKPVVPEAITKWIEENPWYEKDRELRDFALAFNDTYLKRSPEDLEGSLEATAKAVRRAFPEKFQKKDGGNNRQDDDGTKAAPPPGSVEGGGKTGPGGGKKLSVSRLNRDQRLIHDQYVKAGILSSEEYLKGLDEIGELQ